jgi:hypothetical protein
MEEQNKPQEKIYQISMREVDIQNLMAFLNRVDLRGKEVPALLAINNAVKQARPVQEKITNEKEPREGE